MGALPLLWARLFGVWSGAEISVQWIRCDTAIIMTYRIILPLDACFEISERSCNASPFWAGCPAIFVRLVSVVVAVFGGSMRGPG